MTRIPVDQHPAEVEDHGVYRPAGHAHDANIRRSRAITGTAEASRDVKQDRIGYARRALLPLHLDDHPGVSELPEPGFPDVTQRRARSHRAREADPVQPGVETRREAVDADDF